jgi:diguanylate cyclase (GGDEF)-like protein
VVDGLYVQIFGTVLFSLVFLFLWQQSGVVYFKFWCLAWGAEALALLFTAIAQQSRSPRWLIPHALLEFSFALSLVAAARAATPRGNSHWAKWLKALFLFPIFLLITELAGGSDRYGAFQGIHSLAVAVIFLVSFFAFSMDMGATRSVATNLFRFMLMANGLLYLHHAGAYLYMQASGPRPWWTGYMDYLHFYTLALQTLLAFSALAMWIERQQDRVVQIALELDTLRRETSRKDLDHLTGLLNQATLSRRMDLPFVGVVAVCDMDEFKPINDRYGHLTGDEILRNLGHMLQTSVRADDEAFRWGGDEFVLLFHEQKLGVGRRRMTEISDRFAEFRVRGVSGIEIHFSWGAAEGEGRPLRLALEEADREMYLRKRERGHARSASSA